MYFLYKYQLSKVLVEAVIRQQREIIMMGSVHVAENTLTFLWHPVVRGITELGHICISPWAHGHPQKSHRANGKSLVSVLNISFMPLLHKMRGRISVLGYTATVTFVKSQLISNTSSSSYIEKKQQKIGGYQYTVSKSTWDFRWEGQLQGMKKVETDILNQLWKVNWICTGQFNPGTSKPFSISLCSCNHF